MTNIDPPGENDNEFETEDERQFRKEREASGLNDHALLALRLMLPEIIAPIVRLLRSNAEIQDHVRKELADALERTETIPGRVRFKVEGQATGGGAHMGQRISNYNRDIEVARWIEARLSAEPQPLARGCVGNAIQAAADHFLISYKLADAARTRTTKMDQWLSVHMASKPPQLAFMTDEQWESFRQAKYRAIRDNEPPLE